MKDGILYGPLKKEELPWEPKVSPMTVRLKANQNARINMDLSPPHGPKLGGGEACSPNEGMCEYREFESVTMGGMWPGGGACTGLGGHVGSVRRTGTWHTSMSQ